MSFMLPDVTLMKSPSSVFLQDSKYATVAGIGLSYSSQINDDHYIMLYPLLTFIISLFKKYKLFQF